MSSKPQEPDLKNIWQNQETEKTTMSIEEVRIRASRLIRKKHLDVIARSAFVVLAAVFYGVFLMNGRVTPVRELAGFVVLLLLISTIRDLYLSYRRSGQVRTTLQAGPNLAMTSCLDFYRSELERQREFSRQLPSWLLLAVLFILAYLSRDALMRISTDPLRIALQFVLLAAAALIVLMAVRKFEARRVQADIDALDVFEQEIQFGGGHDAGIGDHEK